MLKHTRGVFFGGKTEKNEGRGGAKGVGVAKQKCKLDNILRKPWPWTQCPACNTCAFGWQCERGKKRKKRRDEPSFLVLRHEMANKSCGAWEPKEISRESYMSNKIAGENLRKCYVSHAESSFRAACVLVASRACVSNRHVCWEEVRNYMLSQR